MFWSQRNYCGQIGFYKKPIESEDRLWISPGNLEFPLIGEDQADKQ